MCGIAGFFGKGGRADIEAMTAALAHRGPDGQGLFTDDRWPLRIGHRRLAILDIKGGHQPMWNEDGSVGVVFNGEIYNHAELRRELLSAGHVFRSHHSDTEVLVHGYEEWGEGLPLRLNGMFAFAIWDRRRARLFLARDRFGEKPLYYAAAPGSFVFASELGALARHPAVSTTPDLLALQKFFAYGYIPSPHALYQGCRKLPGGHWLSFELADERLEVREYWRFKIEPDPGLGLGSEPALIEELRSLIFEAVRRRLISDVPLGVLLSGGLDSSMVLAAAVRALPAASLKTFTIGFTEPSFDESPFARAVARAAGTDHQERILGIEQARTLIPQVLGHLDEPLGDPSILPTHLLSAFAREQVTVVLSGDGGDELFAGYDPFLALAPARLYARLVPRGLHRGLRRLSELLPLSGRNMSLDFKLRRSLMGLSYPPSMWNPVWMSALEPARMGELFDTPVRAEELYEEAVSLWDGRPGVDIMDRSLEFYTSFYLRDNILTKVDRAAMASSLESRAVFLDNDIVDFCQRLPHSFKLRGGTRKYLLKKAVGGLLAPEIVGRRKKGFGIPLYQWLRSGIADFPLRPVAGMNADGVEAALGHHRAGRRDERFLLWNWLVLQNNLPMMS